MTPALSNQTNLLNETVRQLMAEILAGQTRSNKGLAAVHGSPEAASVLRTYAALTNVEVEDCLEYWMLAEFMAMSIEIGRRLERRTLPTVPPSQEVDVFFRLTSGNRAQIEVGMQ